MTQREQKKRAPDKPSKVAFDYIKSNLHRVISVSGVHGGLTPDGGRVAMSLFNERFPIAQRETYSLTSDGRVSELADRDQRDAIVREVEITALMDLNTAKALKAWLEKVIPSER